MDGMKRTLCLALLILCAAPVVAQDLLTRVFDAKPGINSGTATAASDLPWLDTDGETDEALPAMTFGDMRALPRDADGAFRLTPGAWQFEAQTFCLFAGKPGPRAGSGYLFTPELIGPKSAVVTKILDRAWQYPDIPQAHIQSLLWAILARARPSQLSPEPRRAAEQLLSVAEIASLEADARERVTGALLQRALDRMPPAAARLFEAEARLRDALTTGASYAEQARLAVPDREPDPEQGDRDVPEGRWTMLDGFLVRFLPQHYTRTIIQVLVPEVSEAVYDARRRITALRGDDGFATEVVYDDTVPALVIPGEPDFKGYAFKRIAYSQPVNGVPQTFTVDDAGWTFAGGMTGQGRLTPEVAPTLAFGGPSDLGQGRDINDRYTDWQQRYKDAKRTYDRSRPLSRKDIGRITDPGHYQKGVKTALGVDPGAKAKWLEDHFNRLGRAAAYIACSLAGGCGDDNGTRTPARAGAARPRRGPQAFKPRGAATPAKNGSQLLGVSGR